MRTVFIGLLGELMPNIEKLYSLYLRQLETVIAESELLLQREGGLDGELKTSGYLCEQFIQNTLEKFIVPKQFRVTSGYIATPALLHANANLPQCDILIADSYSPPLLKLADSKIEVVPAELIIGVIEAKRTLTKKTLSDALDHLQNIVDSTGNAAEFKTDNKLTGYNRSVGFHNHSSSKPLLGIIAMKNEIHNFPEVATELITEKNSLIDFIWTLDGQAMTLAVQLGQTLLHYTHSARPSTKTWNKISISEFSSSDSHFYKQFSGDRTVWAHTHVDELFPKEAVFAQMIGLLTLTMSRIYTKPMREEQVAEYYLRNTFSRS